MLVVEYPTTVPSSSNFEEEVVECRSKFVCIVIISGERRGRRGRRRGPREATRHHTYMTSAKLGDFLTPFPCPHFVLNSSITSPLPPHCKRPILVPSLEGLLSFPHCQPSHSKFNLETKGCVADISGLHRHLGSFTPE